MTVINLGSIDYPRNEEIVTTPQLLLTPGESVGSTKQYPRWPTSMQGIGTSDVDRAGYEQWKQSQGIAGREWPTTFIPGGGAGISGITIGNTTLSNTQIGITLAGAVAGYFAGKKYFSKKEYGYMMALVGALIAYWLSKKYVQ